MDRAFLSGAAGSAPTAPAAPSIGYPTSGNPSSGTPATKPGPWWYHMITEELRAIITAAGLTPSQLDVTQLLQALPGALASRPEMGRSLGVNGYQKLPGGLILQWGTATSAADSPGVTITYPIAFSGIPFFACGSNSNDSVSGAVRVNKLSATQLNVGCSLASQAIHWLAIGN